jgi:RNA polymerase sigma-70 factor (ECF subfamily)
MPTPDEDFERIFAAEYAAVLRAVFLICHDHQRAQDVTQDAFVQLLRHWDKVSRFDRPGAWVRRVAIRLVVRTAHKERLRRQAERTFDPAPLLSPADLDVLHAVRTLPMRQRTAVVLFYFEGASLTEIADVLGCAPSTAGVHLHRGRLKLGLSLKEVDPSGLRPTRR